MYVFELSANRGLLSIPARSHAEIVHFFFSFCQGAQGYVSLVGVWSFTAVMCGKHDSMRTLRILLRTQESFSPLISVPLFQTYGARESISVLSCIFGFEVSFH